MTYANQLRDAIDSGLFSEATSDEIEATLQQYEAGLIEQTELHARAETSFQRELELLEPGAAALARQVAAVLNNSKVTVGYTRPDGVAGERNRWWATMPSQHLQQGLQRLALMLRQAQQDTASADREATRLREMLTTPLVREAAPAPPSATRHENPWERPDAESCCVLRSVKTGRFIGLRPGRRKIHFKNFVRVEHLRDALVLSRGQAALQRALLHNNPRVARHVPGRRNYQIFSLGLQSVD